MQKTNKSLSKRLRVTKTGKVLSRKKGHGHFKAKKSRKYQLDKKRTEYFVISKKTLGKYLPKG